MLRRRRRKKPRLKRRSPRSKGKNKTRGEIKSNAIGLRWMTIGGRGSKETAMMRERIGMKRTGIETVITTPEDVTEMITRGTLKGPDRTIVNTAEIGTDALTKE